MSLNRKDKNRLCVGCWASVPKKTMTSGYYCSNLCKIKNRKNPNRCKPACRPSDLYIKQVTFKNGEQHTKQGCRLCVRAIYLPYGATKVESVFIGAAQQRKERVSRYGDSFYARADWLALRYKAFVILGRLCCLCGASSGPMHVDHIKPVSLYPELSLDIKNLQILCGDCNLGKSNKDQTDWRVK